MRRVERLEVIRQAQTIEFRTRYDASGSPKGRRDMTRIIVIPRVECRRHPPRSFAGSDDIHRPVREPIENTPRQRAMDEAERIDTGDACTENLSEVLTEG
jgi:hypothetical protein